MSNDELNDLQRSISELISINSFFSTSINRRKAVGLLNSLNISNDLCPVLFIVDADPRVVTSKTFADISAFSDFSNESEVLFMIGCVFRLTDIRRDGNEQIESLTYEHLHSPYCLVLINPIFDEFSFGIKFIIYSS